jgi:hypothetical protein
MFLPFFTPLNHSTRAHLWKTLFLFVMRGNVKPLSASMSVGNFLLLNEE